MCCSVNSAEGEYRIFGRLGEFILIIGNLYKGHRLFCCKKYINGKALVDWTHFTCKIVINPSL